MKNRKKYMVFMLAFTLCFSFAACGGKGGGEESGNEGEDNYETSRVIESAVYDPNDGETPDAGFADIADMWCLDGNPLSDKIEIDEEGEWTRYECPEKDGNSFIADYGYLERHQAVDSWYYAHSIQDENAVYELIFSIDKDCFVFGEEEAHYDRLTDPEDNPAWRLGYNSIGDMRTREHEIISSDDEDNMVAEGYWYPDGNRDSLTYFKIERDTLYWYEFDPEQGDVPGEAEGLVFKIGSKRRLKSGETFQYTDALNREESKIRFEGDTTEYYWRAR